jgi:urea carboxylase
VIEVLQAGTQSSIQDFPGRVGYWDIGVPPSGPMDDYAFQLANQIVGNDASAAGFEFTLQGPSLKFHQDSVIALTGAPCPAQLDNETVAFWQPIHVHAGQVLSLGQVESGCRSYLAVRHGLDVPLYLGSRSTFALGNFGGHAGRVLRAGDMIKLVNTTHPNSDTPLATQEPQALSSALIPSYGREWKIGVLYGPHGAPDFFKPEYIEEFFASEWTVHFNSNRLGIRLSGPTPSWARENGGEAGLHPSNVHDCEYAIGAINFTGDFPVILAVGNIDHVAQVDDQLTVASPEPESKFYTVKSGDNLSKISKTFYGDANQYNKIFEANRPLLKDADDIFPGQVLRIPA